MTQAGENIGPGRGKHYSGKDERWPWQGQTLGRVGENITLARTNGGVTRTNDGVARTNDRVARTNDGVARTNDGVARTNDGVARTNDRVARTNGTWRGRTTVWRGRTTVWRGHTSKSHKKEIMSLLSFHSIHYRTCVQWCRVVGLSEPCKSDGSSDWPRVGRKSTLMDVGAVFIRQDPRKSTMDEYLAHKANLLWMKDSLC